jgi:hypothetical protein
LLVQRGHSTTNQMHYSMPNGALGHFAQSTV